MDSDISNDVNTVTDEPSCDRKGAGGLWSRLRHLYLYKFGVRLTSFGLVGVSGLLVNSLILAALTEIGGVHYLLSSIMSTQGSSLWNFGLCEGWVFRDKRADGRTLQRLFLFMLMNNATLILRAPILFLLTSGMGVHYLLSNFIAISMMALVRFVMSDRWIWNGPQERSNGPITYDIHDIISVESTVPLPELEHFRVQSGSLAPDIRVRVGKLGLQEALEQTKAYPNTRAIEYSEGIGPSRSRCEYFWAIQPRWPCPALSRHRPMCCIPTSSSRFCAGRSSEKATLWCTGPASLRTVRLSCCPRRPIRARRQPYCELSPDTLIPSSRTT